MASIDWAKQLQDETREAFKFRGLVGSILQIWLYFHNRRNNDKCVVRTLCQSTDHRPRHQIRTHDGEQDKDTSKSQVLAQDIIPGR